MRTTLLLIFMFFINSATYAADSSLAAFEDEKQQKSGWAFYLDNDVFASDKNDRDYTGGMSVTLSGTRAAKYLLSVDPALDAINAWTGIGQSSDKTLHSFEFGLTAFTPENIISESILLDDRPYASLIYVSNTQQYVNLKSKSSVISSLTLGVLGLDVAADFQNTIHEVVDAQQAQGWQHQISEGGEPTFRYSLAKQQVRWSSYSKENFNYEIKTANSLSLGYLTEASWSVSGRFGRLRSPWSSFNPQNVAYAEKNLPLAKANSNYKNEYYIWAGLSLHARAYNALLQGQFRDSDVTYDSDELRHIVNEAWVGITKELDSGIRFSYFIRGQSAEIKTGPGSRNPVWGGIIISRSV